MFERHTRISKPADTRLTATHAAIDAQQKLMQECKVIEANICHNGFVGHQLRNMAEDQVQALLSMDETLNRALARSHAEYIELVRINVMPFLVGEYLERIRQQAKLLSVILPSFNDVRHGCGYTEDFAIIRDMVERFARCNCPGLLKVLFAILEPDVRQTLLVDYEVGRLCMRTAVYKGSTSIIAALLDIGMHPAYWHDKPIHESSNFHLEEILAHLRSNFRKSIDEGRSVTYDYLLYLTNSHADMLKLLINAGADADLSGPQSSNARGQATGFIESMAQTLAARKIIETESEIERMKKYYPKDFSLVERDKVISAINEAIQLIITAPRLNAVNAAKCKM